MSPVPRMRLGALAILLALTALVMGWNPPSVSTYASSQATPVPLATATLPAGQSRETQGNGEAPDISFIDSPSAICSRLAAGADTCLIEWSYLYVAASTSSYVISMTVTIDGRLRAYHGGFFQTDMFLPGQMYLPGLKVACGVPGSGGVSGMGAAHSYTIRARDTSGLGAANYGSVICPAGLYRVYLPAAVR